MRELIIGCGKHKEKKLIAPTLKVDYENPTTLDINQDVNPDVVHDLNDIPLPFGDNEFDEIHAYEVLEHIGRQGDCKFFLNQFADFWRILKHNGRICCSVPSFNSMWAWGDPGHTRIINEGSLIFLSQEEYRQQVDMGKTPMTDYRHMYKADFETEFKDLKENNFFFVLKAIKENENE